MSTLCLSLHAEYVCQHSGACCTAGWPIPIEAGPRRIVVRAIREGRLTAPVAWQVNASAEGAAADPILAQDARGRCVFRRDCRCGLQHALGPAAQPSACRHFPRRFLVDGRGVSVTLSHFCPTAASLLFESGGPVRIVPGPTLEAEISTLGGLDALDAWPPLLTPRRLMDLPAYARWEQHAVDTLANADALSPEERVAVLLDHTARCEQWRPGRNTFAEAIDCMTSMPIGDSLPGRSVLGTIDEHALFGAVVAAILPPCTWLPALSDHVRVWQRRIADRWPEFAPVVGRYLAAHAFASWSAYQSTRLTTTVLAVAAALAVLKIEVARACADAARSLDAELLKRAIRQSDLLLRHYIDPQTFSDALESCSRRRPNEVAGALTAERY